MSNAPSTSRPLLALGAGVVLLSSVFLDQAHAAVRLPPAVKSEQTNGASICGAHTSIARDWNEQVLAAIRLDAPRPTVHARNLFHLSVAMYDAWAAYEPTARAHLHEEAAVAVGSVAAARNEAISYAAYRLLAHRFQVSPAAAVSLQAFSNCMTALGFDTAVTSTTASSPAALGNRVAATIIAHGLQDQSNEQGSYLDGGVYIPRNAPMMVGLPGTGGVVDINAWQPLIPPGAPGGQAFLTPHWREVTPFALTRSAPGTPYLDAGVPPRLGGPGDAALKQTVIELIRLSGELDPDDGVMMDISPGTLGDNTLGTNDGGGHAVNPSIGVPYAANVVLRGDYVRVLSEFWADGPRSSTPPGHWNEVANAVTDALGSNLRMGGVGPVLSALEWDVKLYLALNGGNHDTAIATWENKRRYDASRPITLIREMGSLGQSSDPLLPSYHVQGLPLEPGVVELITVASSAAGERHEQLAAFVGEIAIYAWRGHPAIPASEHGGVGWIRAVSWIPYQQRNFVTPPFPGYTSGHSGFSRSSAEVLAAFTGDEYFPGGLGEFLVSSDDPSFHLGFEFGPSQPVRLQWATYFDAADEAGRSRIHGGIHPNYDDLPARVIGHEAGLSAIARAQTLFGSGAPAAVPVIIPTGGFAAVCGLIGSLLLLGLWRLRFR